MCDSLPAEPVDCTRQWDVSTAVRSTFQRVTRCLRSGPQLPATANLHGSAEEGRGEREKLVTAQKLAGPCVVFAAQPHTTLPPTTRGTQRLGPANTATTRLLAALYRVYVQVYTITALRKSDGRSHDGRVILHLEKLKIGHPPLPRIPEAPPKGADFGLTASSQRETGYLGRARDIPD